MDLVVRGIPTVGSHDHAIDVVSNPYGEITVDTGIDATKGIETICMSEAAAEVDTATGELVAPNVVAAYHDHDASFRPNLDVDGHANTLIREETTPRRVEGPGTRRPPADAGHLLRSICGSRPMTATSSSPRATVPCRAAGATGCRKS